MKTKVLLLLSLSFISLTSVNAQGLIIHKKSGQNIYVLHSQVDSVSTIKPSYHEYVDLGLPSGTLWATTNIGAVKPEDYGDYFAWGEINGCNSGKVDWTINNYSYFIKTDTQGYYYFTKYSATDKKVELDLEDDVAAVQWGGDWRVPSKEQGKELVDECNTSWVTEGGVNGYLIVSKHNGNSIFIPAAGRYEETALYSTNVFGYYMLRNIYEDVNRNACCSFNIGQTHIGAGGGPNTHRYYGYSVRPVLLIKVTSISLDQTSVTLGVGKNVTLVATVLPENASNPKVEWTSSDKSVATVADDGEVTALGEGMTIITAKAEDGSGKKAQCLVIVE